jgi:hypothetical protein
MPHTAVTVRAEQRALLSMRDLVLHQLVRYQQLIFTDLLREVMMTDDTHLRLFLGDVEHETGVRHLFVLSFSITTVASHTAQRSVLGLNRLGLDEIFASDGRVICTGLEWRQREMAIVTSLRDIASIFHHWECRRRWGRRWA